VRGGLPLAGLNAFERDLLFAVIDIGGGSGVDAQDRLERLRETDVTSSNVYQAMSSLEEMDMVEVLDTSGRGKHYRATSYGEGCAQALAMRLDELAG
jgi:Fe2+ or Zn2+ uptake regulation protein